MGGVLNALSEFLLCSAAGCAQADQDVSINATNSGRFKQEEKFALRQSSIAIRWF
jgi:hypothetical protein